MAIIDLTTTARVRALLGIPDDDTSADTNVGRLITSVSARIERYLRRSVEVAARTEYFDCDVGIYQHSLAAFPVTSLTSVKNSQSYAWADATAKVEGADFTLDSASGVITQLRYWLVGSRTVQVVYTGGLAANTAAILSTYPDLADACEKQVVEEHNRRGSMLRKSSSVSGATEASESVTLLPIVREILAPYRRPVW